MLVQKLIHDCGGAASVAAASQRTDRPVSVAAVLKWYRNGIPESHWPLVCELSSRTVQEIYDVNRMTKRQRSPPGKTRLRRSRSRKPRRPQSVAA